MENPNTDNWNAQDDKRMSEFHVNGRAQETNKNAQLNETNEVWARLQYIDWKWEHSSRFNWKQKRKTWINEAKIGSLWSEKRRETGVCGFGERWEYEWKKPTLKNVHTQW